MDEEIKQLLQENLKISKESLEILKEIKRKNQLSLILKIIYWLVLILIIYYSYQLLLPYKNYFKQSFELFKNMQ